MNNKEEEEWRNDFSKFLEYVLKEIGDREEGMTIDRIDNNEGYKKGNIRWATRREQRENQRQGVDGCYNE